MGPRTRWTLAFAAIVIAAGAWLGTHWLQQRRVGGVFGHVQILHPAGDPRSLVLLLKDDAAGLGDTARQLADAGAVVGVVDAGRYLQRRGDKDPQASDELKWLGLRVLRGAGVDTYLSPMLLGAGAGCTLVHEAVNEEPEVWRNAVVLDDAACTVKAARGVEQAAGSRLAATVIGHFPAQASPFGGLPLVELPNPGSDRLVILLSGDGGWAALDKTLADDLHAQGHAVLGWNSLRYFWAEKTPERAAADLSAVIAHYQHRWHVSRVDLVGYSFGADVLPFLYARLPAAQQAQIRTVSLLGLAPSTGFTVRIGGWLGWRGGSEHEVRPQLAAIPAGKVLCVYGRDEDDSLCPALQGTGIAVRMTEGGHHFGGPPGALAALVSAPRGVPSTAGLSPVAVAIPAR